MKKDKLVHAIKFTTAAKLFYLALIIFSIMLFLSACTKKHGPTAPDESQSTSTDTPAGTPTITGTDTFSPTISDTWTITETATVTDTATITETVTDSPTDTVTETATPTSTVTPTFTVTCTETPFIVDMFEDNDFYDNVNPGANMWYDYINPDTLPNTISNFSICGGCGAAGGHALDLQGIVYPSVPDGSGGFYGYYGAAAPINSGTSVGFDFTQYRFINFEIDNHIFAPVPPQTAVTSIYRMKLLDNNGNIIEQDFLPPPSPNDEAWYSYQLSMSSFSLPAGASGYTASQVLSNVTELRWECVVDSLVNTDSAESWLWLDNINLEK